MALSRVGTGAGAGAVTDTVAALAAEASCLSHVEAMTAQSELSVTQAHVWGYLPLAGADRIKELKGTVCSPLEDDLAVAEPKACGSGCCPRPPGTYATTRTRGTEDFHPAGRGPGHPISPTRSDRLRALHPA